VAKVSYGPIVSDASGKSAGTVFSKWRTRSYIRRLVTPGNPNTAAQQAIRNAFIIQTDRFLRFNSDLVQSWRNFAAGKPLTDRSAFIGATVQEKRLATPWPFTPHDPTVFPVLNLAATPGVGTMTLDWNNDLLPAAGDTLVFTVQETDNELTVAMQTELLSAVSALVSGLTSGKSYLFGVSKKDSGPAPNRYGLAISLLAVPT